jgi:hypothetical protein
MDVLVLAPCHLKQLIAEAPALVVRISSARRIRMATL